MCKAESEKFRASDEIDVAKYAGNTSDFSIPYVGLVGVEYLLVVTWVLNCG